MNIMKTFLFKTEVKNVTNIPDGKQWAIQSLNVPETWKITKGKGVTVMVIDTGLPDHKNLVNSIDLEKSKNFFKSENINDLNGHSTHCCGIIGAKGIDGVFGVAPECKIITVKVLGKNGAGNLFEIEKALEYAKNIKPDVISMSLGYHTNDEDISILIKELHAMNIPIIAASGNDGYQDKVCYPAAHNETICVGAYDKYGNLARFSNSGKRVDFAAPGVDIFNTWLNQTYASLNGTSMATPFVAGIVALLIAKHRKQEKETGFNDCRTVAQIKEHLVKYTDDKGVVGKDNAWGYGVIDVEKLIESKEIHLEKGKEPINTFFDFIKKILQLFSK